MASGAHKFLLLGFGIFLFWWLVARSMGAVFELNIRAILEIYQRLNTALDFQIFLISFSGGTLVNRFVNALLDVSAWFPFLLIFPALALGEKLGLKEAWRMMTGSRLRLWAALVIASAAGSWAVYIINSALIDGLLLWASNNREFAKIYHVQIGSHVLFRIIHSFIGELLFALLLVFKATVLALAYKHFQSRH